VLWRCCLSGRKGIQSVKTEWWGTGVVICLDWARCKWFAYGPTDATATSSLAPVKSRMVYLSGAGLPRLSWKKRPLNGCSVVVVIFQHAVYFVIVLLWFQNVSRWSILVGFAKKRGFRFGLGFRDKRVVNFFMTGHMAWLPSSLIWTINSCIHCQ